jgi:hypothetical protein
MRLLLLAAAAVLIVVQLFVPPVLGVADNCDFEKLRRASCLGPVDPASYPYFDYYEPAYAVRTEYCAAISPSSAEIPLALSMLPSRLFAGKDHYDLRFLAAIYAVLLLLAFWRLTALVRPAVSMAALLVFFTAVYVPMFSTFYKDTATLVCLAWCVPLTIALLKAKRASWRDVAALTLAAFLLGASKTQYLLLPFCFVPVFLASRGTLWQRTVPVAILTAGMAWYAMQGSPWYAAIALYDGLFYKFLPASKNPAADMTDLGLGTRYEQYVGQHAYTNGTRMQEEPYALAFGRVITVPKMVAFLIERPAIVVRAMSHDLEEASLERVRMKIGAREYRLGNYTRASGRLAEQQSGFLTLWSSLKFRLLARRPGIYLAWIVGLVGVLWFAASRQAERRRECIAGAAAITLMLPAIFFPAFLDAVDTGRHLLLFNMAADMIAVAAFALLLPKRRKPATFLGDKDPGGL